MDAKNSLQTYSFNKNEIRIIILNNEPWFILKDVTNALNLKNPSHLAGILENEDKVKIKPSEFVPTSDVSTKARSLWLISESGLYFCVLRSDKPNAVKFQKWITKEVLPKIRKTGSYSLPAKTRKTEKSDRDLLICALELITLLDDIQDKRKELKSKIISKLETTLK